MISLAKLSIFSFVLWSWKYPNYVTELGTSWINGTSQNDTLGVRISRSLRGETYMATAQQNKISGNTNEVIRKSNEVAKMSGRLDSRVQSRRPPNMKNTEHREKIGIKCKGLSKRVAYSRHKKKSLLFLVLTFSIFFPLALACLGLIVVDVYYDCYAQWNIWKGIVPAFIVLVYLWVFMGYYHPVKWFNTYKKNIKIQNIHKKSQK
ncbi:hypothetical protein PCYB_001780 [Plasmodium cynomolgi strain B]|uniref:CYIR protein n=1 Tax=Plasmodium cynomolgi (strain B) TaxID=1120755 RepID=K6V2E7_PLACD|nr:hypothetical protein PCYB_001780 [Plasmodium cynomolgi strain B]GAB69430.1 hypothetical protein PCYB_001780 [Plasmodium cynomolgi strain B]